MIRPIVLWPDPVLKEVSAPVEQIDAEVARLAEDMLETMYDAPGRGLAAPQVGVLRRLFVMDCGWKEGEKTPRVCVNPNIVAASDETAVGPEGCLSIPGVSAEVRRPTRVTLGWTDLAGTRLEAVLEGFEAVCAQHELDHLDGVVTLDRLSPEARAEAEAIYAA